jgi:pilus assembly protein CpaF
MSLTDRLEQARRSSQPTTPNGHESPGHARSAAPRPVDAFAHVKASVHQALMESLGPQLYDPHLEQSDLELRVRQTLQSVINAENTPLAAADRNRIAQEVADEILGLGPLEPLLRDGEITEIMVNGPNDIFVERSGKIFPVDARFTNDTHLRRTIDKIVSRVGRRIDESSPMVDARLADGSRVNAVIAPIALDGSILTIRKFSQDPFTDLDLIAFGTLTVQGRDFLRACVLGRCNIVISGGTGSGKTTLLNVLSSFIPEDERIVTVEDAAELQLRQRHVLRLESRPSNTEGKGQISIRDLVKNALRMRPDRIVVGEIRDGAALDMLQAMNTGHDGSLTTVHANAPRDSLARLETLVLMAGIALPVKAIRDQVASALDIIVQVGRLKDGSRRITAITEVEGMESDVITLQDLFTFDYAAGRDENGRFLGVLRSSGLRPKFTEHLHDLGIELPQSMFIRGVG